VDDGLSVLQVYVCLGDEAKTVDNEGNAFTTVPIDGKPRGDLDGRAASSG